MLIPLLLLRLFADGPTYLGHLLLLFYKKIDYVLHHHQLPNNPLQFKLSISKSFNPVSSSNSLITALYVFSLGFTVPLGICIRNGMLEY